MNIYPNEAIQYAAESIGINNLSNEVYEALAPDIEYRLREIIKEALTFMRHGKRDVVTTEDINNSLKLQNIEPLYGYQDKESFFFKKIHNSKDEYYILEDQELDLEEVMSAPLPKCPIDITYTAHWLAIEGIQPAISENPSVIITSNGSSNRKNNSTQEKSFIPNSRVVSTYNPSGSVEEGETPLVYHVMSKELQLYYESMTEAIFNQQEPIQKIAFESIQNDPGLHQLVPYFCQFSVKKIMENPKNLFTITAIIQLLKALLNNPNLHLEPYLHQILSILLTCVLKKSICKNPYEDHWTIRDLASTLVGQICLKWKSFYPTLHTRIIQTLLKGFLEPSKPLTTNYGAISCIATFGLHAVHLFLLPNLSTYSSFFQSYTSQRADNKILEKEITHVQELLVKVVSNFLLRYPVLSEKEMKLENSQPIILTKKLKETYDVVFGIFGESLLPYINEKNLELIEQIVSLKTMIRRPEQSWPNDFVGSSEMQ